MMCVLPAQLSRRRPEDRAQPRNHHHEWRGRAKSQVDCRVDVSAQLQRACCSTATTPIRPAWTREQVSTCERGKARAVCKQSSQERVQKPSSAKSSQPASRPAAAASALTCPSAAQFQTRRPAPIPRNHLSLDGPEGKVGAYRCASLLQASGLPWDSVGCERVSEGVSERSKHAQVS